MRKSFAKLVPLILCFTLLTITIQGSFAAEKKLKVFNVAQALKGSSGLISSLLPFLTPIFDSGIYVTYLEETNLENKLKVTGDINSRRLPNED